MKGRVLAGVMITGLLSAGAAAQETYEPNWESIDSRPTPQWFEDAKFGIFIHWGLYSVPAWGPKDQYAEWYWRHLMNENSPTRKFHNETYGEDFKYQDFASMWKAELYDPAQWAEVFKRAGARYVVLTSKHHEGFCLWPNGQAWNWNSMDVGPHRDLAGDLVTACRDKDLRIGFYYSLYEWYNPLYRSDVNRYVETHMLPQVKDLVTRYAPDIVWGDGEWDHPSETWRATEFLAWLLNESPCKDYVAINDRWGKETRGKHGGYYTTEYFKVHGDTVTVYDQPWEECRGMGHSFGYNRNEDLANYKSADELTEMLIEIVCRGGNLLLDIGPTADGRIPVIMEERLTQMGKWLAVNGEAIYGSRRWREVSEGDVRYTKQGDAVYAISLKWPGKEIALAAPEPTGETRVTMLGREGELTWRRSDDKVIIEVPPLAPNELPCDYAWTFKLTGVD